MNLIKTTFYSGLYFIIRLLGGVASLKVIAIYLGPVGMAYLGQFQSFVNMLTNYSNLGISNGIVKYISEFSEEENTYNKIIGTSFLITCCVSTLFAIFMLFLPYWLSYYLFDTDKYGYIFIILSITIFAFSLSKLLISILNGFKNVKKLIYSQIISTILTYGLTIVLVIFKTITGALLSLIIGQILTLFVLIIYCLKFDWFTIKKFFSGLHYSSAKKLLNYSLMTFSSIILLNLKQIYLRKYIITNLSDIDAGNWQAIWKISEYYLMAITYSLSIYYLPKLSQLKSRAELRREIFQGYKIILPIVFIIGITIYLFRDILISLFFTEKFEIRDLFLFQIIGDFLKISSWLLSYLLVAKAMTKEFVITEVIFKFSFIGFSIFFIEYFKFGVISLTYAHAVNYLIYLFIMIYIFRKLIFKV